MSSSPSSPSSPSASAASPKQQQPNAAEGKGKNVKGKGKKSKRDGVITMMSYIPKVAKTIKNGTSTTPEFTATVHGIIVDPFMKRFLRELQYYRDVSKNNRISLTHVRCGLKAVLSERSRFDGIDEFASDKVAIYERNMTKDKIKKDKKKNQKKKEAETVEQVA